MSRKDIKDLERSHASLPLRLALAAGLLPGTALPATQVEERDQIHTVPSGQTSQVNIVGRMSALCSNPNWAVIRSIWRTIGSIEPGENGYQVEAMSREQAQEIRQELYPAIEGLLEDAPELGLDSIEINALSALIQNRVDLLSWGMMAPMTRMMPPPVSDQMDGIVGRIETRIDVLIDLREMGLLEGPELREAFGLLSEDVGIYSALLSARTHVGYDGLLWSMQWPEDIDSILTAAGELRESMLQAIEESGESYQGQLEDVTGNFDALLLDLESMKTRIPAMNELLLDLELF